MEGRVRMNRPDKTDGRDAERDLRYALSLASVARPEILAWVERAKGPVQAAELREIFEAWK